MIMHYDLIAAEMHKWGIMTQCETEDEAQTTCLGHDTDWQGFNNKDNYVDELMPDVPWGTPEDDNNV